MVRAPSADAFAGDCRGRVVLDHVTSRWGFLVLVSLRDGPARFFQLRERIQGVSETRLSAALKTLTSDGLLERTVTPTTPPQVTYSLTRLGHGAAERLAQVHIWIKENAHRLTITDE